MLLGDNPASFPYLRARAHVVSRVNGTDIRMFIMAGLDAHELQSKLLIGASLSEPLFRRVGWCISLVYIYTAAKKYRYKRSRDK